jgi:Na+/phosphate symporter
MTMHTFKMSETHAEMIFKLVDQHTSALRNWTASAVEDGDFERAQALVKDLRRHQDIYRAFNMSAVREIAARRECPVETQHTVYIA